MEGLCLCELCGKRARMLCESEQAKLCWDCDRKVHSANFLVAKHSRVLLCHLYQSPTPWKACGPSLTPTSSLCHPCSSLPNPIPIPIPIPPTQSHNHHHHHHVPEEEEEEEEEEEGENQVVPWSSPSASANSDTDGDISSSATASAGARCRLPLKRFQHNSFIHDSDDEIGCSSSEASPNDESSSMTMSMFRPLKQPRINHRVAAPAPNT